MWWLSVKIQRNGMLYTFSRSAKLELKPRYGVWTTICNKSLPISSLFSLLHASGWYLMIWETDPFYRINVTLGANMQRYWLIRVEFEETKSPMMFGRLFTLCFIPCPCSHCPFQASMTIEMIGKPLYSGYLTWFSAKIELYWLKWTKFEKPKNSIMFGRMFPLSLLLFTTSSVRIHASLACL